MMSFRTMYSRERPNSEATTIGFRFGEEGFVMEFGSDGIRARRAEPDGCALTLITNPMSLASVVYGSRPIADAEASGELTLAGDQALFHRFMKWFPLPEKIGYPTSQPRARMRWSLDYSPDLKESQMQ